MKWRSKATGAEYDAYDALGNSKFGYRVGITPTGHKASQDVSFLTYAELIEAFEKVEE